MVIKTALIIGAGKIYDFSELKSFVYENKCFVIAADAGYYNALRADIKPDLIVGDFDSGVEPETDIEKLVLNPVKDKTDMEVCIEEAVKNGAKSIAVFGGLGGRFSHTMANIEMCVKYREYGISIFLYDENSRIRILINEKAELEKSVYKYISVFSLSDFCRLSMDGFFYDLNHFTLKNKTTLGTSNELVKEKGIIEVLEGILLVIEEKI